MTDTLPMKFEAHSEKWYQKDRQKNSSGSCEWHSLTAKQRQISRAIAAFSRPKKGSKAE